MNTFIDFIENRLAPPFIKISQNRYLDAISKSFIIYMPYLLISSLFLLITSLPIPGWSDIVAPIAPLFGSVVNSTLGVIAIGFTVAIGYNLGVYYNKLDDRVQPLPMALVALISFLFLFPVTVLEEGAVVMSAAHFDSNGIFPAMIVSILSCEIYRFIVNKNLVIKMPEQVPPMVTQAFASILPAFSVIVFWFVALRVIEFDLIGLVDSVFEPIMFAGSSALAQFLALILDRVLWFVGIHGSNIVGSVMTPVWTQMITENINAFSSGGEAPYLFTNVWIEWTVRVSILPLVILMLMSKVERYNTLGKLSLAPSLFNIAEPVMFGLPLVLNPILFIPWVFGYAVTFIVSYIFTAIIPLIPPMVATVPWTTPGPIGAYLASNGSWAAVAVNVLNYVLMFFIWLPFFKVLERQELEKETKDETNSELEKETLTENN